MLFLIIKAVVSAFTIILITWVAKKTSLLGGLIAMMPINIILSLIWLHIEKKDMLLLANFTKAALIGVIPTIIFLGIVLYLLTKQEKFATTLLVSIIALGCLAFIQYKILKLI